MCSVLYFSEVWWVGRKFPTVSTGKAAWRSQAGLLKLGWWRKPQPSCRPAYFHACRIHRCARISMHGELHWVTNRLHVLDTLRMTAERAIAALLLSPPSVIALRPIRTGKLPGSLICAAYMYIYIYAMHDFNRLMSAMSIDGIWQNNLITLFLRLDRMQLASLVYVSVSMPANCIFPTKMPNSRHYIIPCMHVHWYLGT